MSDTFLILRFVIEYLEAYLPPTANFRYASSSSSMAGFFFFVPHPPSSSISAIASSSSFNDPPLPPPPSIDSSSPSTSSSSLRLILVYHVLVHLYQPVCIGSAMGTNTSGLVQDDSSWFFL